MNIHVIGGMYMSISKENIYNIKYTAIIGENNKKRKNWTSKLKKIIYENKIISIFISIFISCVIMNLFLIYNFLKILQQI